MVERRHKIFTMWQYQLLFWAVVAVATAKQRQSPIVLGENDWERMLEGEWMVKFYAPWCPACKALTSTWEDIAGWSDDLEITVADVDVTENPGLSGRFLVTALPTIYHVKDGQFRQYRGSRDENSIISFVDEKKWLEADPLPWYTSPTSMHMGALAYFFRLSIGIRDLHNKITSDYGIPVWGSYCMFAVATIVVGLLLGLLLVFLCDVVYPPKQPVPTKYMKGPPIGPGPSVLHPDDKDNESDIIEDDRPPKTEAEKKEQENSHSEPKPEEEGEQADQETPEENQGDASDVNVARRRKPQTTD